MHASFFLVRMFYYVFFDEHHVQQVTANASCVQICWRKEAYNNDHLTALDSWWLIFLACPLFLIICNAAVNWTWKLGAVHGCEMKRRQGQGN